MEKKFYFWMHRVLDEKTMDLKEIASRISLLNHQIRVFEGIGLIDDKITVVEHLIADMEKYGWENAVKDMKKILEELKANTS